MIDNRYSLAVRLKALIDGNITERGKLQVKLEKLRKQCEVLSETLTLLEGMENAGANV